MIADSATTKWPGLFVWRYPFPRVVDGFLVPATAKPLIAAIIAGSAEFEEREVGGPGYLTTCGAETCLSPRSTTPYELRWRSPLGAELDVIHVHIAVDQCLAAFEMVYKGKASDVEVTEFFDRDETLAHLTFACAEMLSTGTAGNSQVSGPLHICSRFVSPRNTLTLEDLRTVAPAFAKYTEGPLLNGLWKRPDLSPSPRLAS